MAHEPVRRDRRTSTSTVVLRWILVALLIPVGLAASWLGPSQGASVILQGVIGGVAGISVLATPVTRDRINSVPTVVAGVLCLAGAVFVDLLLVAVMWSATGLWLADLAVALLVNSVSIALSRPLRGRWRGIGSAVLVTVGLAFGVYEVSGTIMSTADWGVKALVVALSGVLMAVTLLEELMWHHRLTATDDLVAFARMAHIAWQSKRAIARELALRAERRRRGIARRRAVHAAFGV